jgi:3-deoxy-manno-octulosonate cytidylyltransferase (CMP-KDO synthetase)
MIIGLIPARLNSTRLPNKPLLNIDGYPLVMHVYSRAKLSKKLDRVIICADDYKIYKAVKKYGGECILTSKKHKNGTERICEIAKKLNAEFIVDIQCDACFINPSDIDKLITFHRKNENFDIVIPHSKFNIKNDYSAVKIYSNKNNKILYMSRNDIPYNFYKKKISLKRHQDFISFKKKSLLKFSKLNRSYLENLEGIELLRALENNMDLGTFKIRDENPVSSINTKQDYINGKKRMKFDSIKNKYHRMTER